MGATRRGLSEHHLDVGERNKVAVADRFVARVKAGEERLQRNHHSCGGLALAVYESAPQRKRAGLDPQAVEPLLHVLDVLTRPVLGVGWGKRRHDAHEQNAGGEHRRSSSHRTRSFARVGVLPLPAARPLVRAP